MKQKYIALALSTIFATALVGCGSDDDSNYIPPGANNPDNGNTGATGGNTGATGGNTGATGGNTGATGGNTGTTGGNTGTTGGNTGTTGGTPETPDDTTGSTDNPTDNPGGAAEDGNRAEKSSVVGQQYVRGSNSNFDKTQSTNGIAGNDGNNTVVGFRTLQNEKMTNIVVAQFPDASNLDANGKPNIVKYILGSEPVSVADTDVNNTNSIQLNNDVDFDNDINTQLGSNILVQVQQTSTGSGAPTYQITGQESVVNGISNRVTQTATGVTGSTNGANDNDVRVFGKLATTADETATGYFNSAEYRTKDALGNNLVLKGVDAAGTGPGDEFNVRALKLNNVQYGRVTGALDSLTTEQLQGQNYVKAEFANKDFAGNTNQTDVYFYRGVGETSLGQMAALNKTGVYQYAGHALMYGINNSYSGPEGEGGNSNAPAFGVSGDAVGNFVQAQYNSGDQTVTGSIYNVWDKGAANGQFEAVDLVNFGGNVVGNSVKGNAQLAYGAAADGKGSFKGSFFGNKAQELGGALNSIDSKTGYGDSKWGGVFGAQQITPETIVTPPVGVPPINGVE